MATNPDPAPGDPAGTPTDPPVATPVDLPPAEPSDYPAPATEPPAETP